MINAGFCFECKTLIASRHFNDPRECDCGAIGVYGGPGYMLTRFTPGLQFRFFASREDLVVFLDWQLAQGEL